MATPKHFHMTKKSADAEIKHIQYVDCAWCDLRIFKTQKTGKVKF